MLYQYDIRAKERIFGNRGVFFPFYFHDNTIIQMYSVSCQKSQLPYMSGQCASIFEGNFEDDARLKGKDQSVSNKKKESQVFMGQVFATIFFPLPLERRRKNNLRETDC